MAFDRKKYKAEWDKKRHDYTIKLMARWKTFKGCSICGYNKCSASLQLDHLDPSTKCSTLKRQKRAYNPKWNKNRLKKELAKCQVLCANCHAERTFNEKHFMHEGNSVGPT